MLNGILPDLDRPVGIVARLSAIPYPFINQLRIEIRGNTIEGFSFPATQSALSCLFFRFCRLFMEFVIPIVTGQVQSDSEDSTLMGKEALNTLTQAFYETQGFLRLGFNERRATARWSYNVIIIRKRVLKSSGNYRHQSMLHPRKRKHSNKLQKRCRGRDSNMPVRVNIE